MADTPKSPIIDALVRAGSGDGGWGALPKPGEKPYKIERTGPDVLRRHDISDEELNMLADTRRDYIWEGKWVALGLLLGVTPACFDELRDAYFIDNPSPLTPGDLFQLFIFVGSGVAFLILWYVSRRKSKDAKDLAAAIRERTAKEVS